MLQYPNDIGKSQTGAVEETVETPAVKGTMNTIIDETTGLACNIQKYTIHDGPGIRTAVFFKGCSLRCLWCSNPETISPMQQLGVYPSKCLSVKKCGYCIKACPVSDSSPIDHDEDGLLRSISMVSSCKGCYLCADACPSRAIKLWGEAYTIDDLMRIIEEDKRFYDRSGGGVTLSGGEVMLQWKFATQLLKACKEAGINTCVETALNCSAEHMESVYRYTDLVLADIKHMNTEKHLELTGFGNEHILENIKRTVLMGKKTILRTPVVIGYNSDEANIRASGAFVRDALGSRIEQYQLLPYRKMGTEKYDSLGESYPLRDYEPPSRDIWEPTLRLLAKILSEEFGLPAVAGTGNTGYSSRIAGEGM